MLLFPILIFILIFLSSLLSFHISLLFLCFEVLPLTVFGNIIGLRKFENAGHHIVVILAAKLCDYSILK